MTQVSSPVPKPGIVPIPRFTGLPCPLSRYPRGEESPRTPSSKVSTLFQVADTEPVEDFVLRRRMLSFPTNYLFPFCLYPLVPKRIPLSPPSPQRYGGLGFRTGKLLREQAWVPFPRGTGWRAAEAARPPHGPPRPTAAPSLRPALAPSSLYLKATVLVPFFPANETEKGGGTIHNLGCTIGTPPPFQNTHTHTRKEKGMQPLSDFEKLLYESHFNLF